VVEHGVLELQHMGLAEVAEHEVQRDIQPVLPRIQLMLARS
jgi:hypothetical protein